jgi:hypothetical protein
MLHAVTWKRLCWLPLAILIACGDSSVDNGFLSASRIALTERDTARIHVAVASIDDFVVDAPAGVTVSPVLDGSGPAFDLRCRARQRRRPRGARPRALGISQRRGRGGRHR